MSLITDLIRLIPPTFRSGYCPQPDNFQTLANDLIGGTRATLLVDTGNFLYNFGSTTPIPENRIFPWLHSPSGRWYIFQYGLWTSPMDPATREPTFLKLWKPPVGTAESALWSLDGGDGTDPSTNPPSATTGASWEVDHTMDGRVFIGAGAIPVTTNPAVSLSVGQTFGEGQHALVEDELPSITVDVPIPKDGSAPDNFDGTQRSNDGTSEDILWPSNPVGGNLPHNNIQPVLAGYFIRPTLRSFYTLPP